MHKMMELRDMLCDELEQFTQVDKLSSQQLDTVDKLTHSIKSIDTIIAMEDAGYSKDDYSPARMRGRYSGRTYGRYSRNYSGDTKHTIEQIEKMLDELKGQS